MKRQICVALGLTLVLFLTANHLSLAQSTRVIHTVTLKIEGMGCRACAKEIRSALLNLPGVKAAEVTVGKKWFFFDDFSHARAVIEFEQAKTTINGLIRAVEDASNSMFTYTARLIE